MSEQSPDNVVSQDAVAFLFEENEGTRRAITRDPAGQHLPEAAKGWTMARTFLLAVEHVPPVDVEPEPIIRAIESEGVYCWDTTKVQQPKGTGQ